MICVIIEQIERNRGVDLDVTRKLWFQLGVATLLLLLITKFLIDVQWIFAPFFILISTIFIPLLISGVLYYITAPLQTFLERYKFPRFASIGVIFLLIIAAVFIAVIIVVPPINEEINGLIKIAPQIIQNSNDFVIDMLEKSGSLPAWLDETIVKSTQYINTFSLNFGRWIVQFFQSIIQGALILVLVPFFLLFMLKDHEKFIPSITRFFSTNTGKWISKTLKDIDNVLGLYIQGQILISIILAIMLFTGYSIIGLNYALLLAVFALFMNIIPFIGPWIAFVPALLIAYFQEPKLVLLVCIITLAAQQIDANLITPNIMGKTLSIHPLTIIVVLFTAGKIAGFLGILLAVPTYAVGKSIVSNIYDKRRKIKQTITKSI